MDTLNPTGLPQVLDETVNSSVTRTYGYGLQRISENQLNGSTWTPSFYGYDGHGNVRFLTNSAATVTDTYQYDAFGRLIATTGSTPNNFKYSGEQFDSNVGLYNLRARYYNQTTGRFWARDPEEGATDSPVTLNPYIYASDDSVDEIDPTGRSAGTIALPAPKEVAGSASLDYIGVVAAVDLAAIAASRDLAEKINCKYEWIGSRFAAWVGIAPSPGNVQKAGDECDDCARDEAAIQRALDEVIGRYEELEADAHNLYCEPDPGGWGTWEGHLYQYREAQTDLENAIERADTHKCPVSAEARKWVNKPPPSCPLK